MFTMVTADGPDEAHHADTEVNKLLIRYPILGKMCTTQHFQYVME